MEAKDLFITPIVLVIVYSILYWVRPRVTDRFTKRYFIPAFTLKVFGALAVGFIYQFYYKGGDTFTYFHMGSRFIWEAFLDRPILAIKLIFAGQEYSGDTFQYASKIYTYGDTASYFVVRIAGIFDILTYHTYSATAVLFAAISFTGLWALYWVFYDLYPKLHLQLAIAVFFIPSVFFWGSGILKDTITLGALGWATFSIYNLFIINRYQALSVFILLIAFFTIYSIKIYILLCFLPAAVLWISYLKIKKLNNLMLRIMVAPLVLSIAAVVGYYAIVKVAEDNPRYNIEQISETARVTAEWIHYVSEREQGSAYTLGDFDFTPLGMIRKFPLAVWVTLYRPHLWEVKNVVMLLSSLESFALLLFTIFVFFKTGFIRVFQYILSKPELAFCFVFSIVFAFAVGITTYNFGSLVRYKIPMFPYFISGLVILLSYSKSARKEARLA